MIYNMSWKIIGSFFGLILVVLGGLYLNANSQSNSYENVGLLQTYVVKSFSAREGVIEASPSTASGEIVLDLTTDYKIDNGIKVSIDELHRRIYNMNKVDADKEIASFVFNTLKALKPRKLDYKRIFANIRSRAWSDGKNPEDSDMVGASLVGDMISILQLDVEGGWSSIGWNEIGGQQEFENLYSQALINNAALVPSIKSASNPDGSVTYYLETSSSLMPGMLLTDGFKSALNSKYQDGYFVIFPNRQEIVVFNKANENALDDARTFINAKLNDNNAEPLSYNVFEYYQGKLVVIEG